MSNADTVRAIYQAFATANVPAILERLSETVEWEYQPKSTDVPWLQPRRGRQEVVGFFQALSQAKVEHFAPTAIVEGPNLVIALVDIELSLPNGRRIHEMDEAHVWHFDARGQVVRFRHCADTAQHA